MANDTPVKIPGGWKVIKDLKINDLVVAKDGTYTKVTGIYPQGELESYTIMFEDLRSRRCSGDHLWEVHREIIKNGKYTIDFVKEVMTTEKIMNLLKSDIGDSFYIPTVTPEQCEDKAFDIDPEIYGMHIDRFYTDESFDSYLEGSREQKIKLLEGLDYYLGSKNLILPSHGTYTFISVYEQDSKGMITKKLSVEKMEQLIWSLGGITTYGYDRLGYFIDSYGRSLLKIQDVRKNNFKEEMTCIAVEHPDKLFVVKDYIVTHNTIIGFSIVAKKQQKTVILLPSYLDKWQSDTLHTMDIESNRVFLIQGFKSIEKLIHEYKMFGKLDYDIFIIAGATFSNFIRDSESRKVNIKPEEFLDMLDFGTLLIDEVHERFFTVYQFCLYCNPETIVAMTATFTSSNEYVQKFQQMMFPSHTRLNFVPINKYINTIAVQYSLANTNSVKYKNGDMYSHDVYENATIIKYRSRLMNYIEMIEYYIDNEYLDKNYKKGNKLLIFVASIRLATMLTEYLKSRYKNLDTRRYVGEDDYENVIEPDVRVSTMGSASTAVDIPGLTVVLNTVLARTPVGNKQSQGRLREIKDVEVRYIYFYCANIDKHRKFNNIRTEQLKPYSKTYKEITYNKKI